MESEDIRALNLLKSLININTVNRPGNEEELAYVIKDFAEKHNLYAEMKPVTENRSNVIVKLEGENSQLPSLIFSGHLDTVPIGEEKYWDVDPFGGVIKNGKLYGRGACDMKGGVAAILEAMVFLKESGFKPNMDVVYVGTVGEEVDCIGSKTIVRDKVFNNVGAMIIAEPSNNNIFTAHKGAYWLKISLYGQTAHGSMPAEGKNAILAAQTLTTNIYNLEFLTSIKNQLLGFSSANVSMIEGGVNTNVVPDFCSLTVDFRTVPGVNHPDIFENLVFILNEMKNNKEIIDWNIDVLHDLPPLSNNKGDDFIDLAFKIKNEKSVIQKKELGVNYYTDGSIYGQELDIPILIMGPGDEKLAHQPNEYLDIEKYYEAIENYVNITKEYSNTK